MRFEEAYRGLQKGRFKVFTNLLKSAGPNKNPTSEIMHIEQYPGGYSG